MPNPRKDKGKAAAPMPAPSMDNRQRYRTPEVLCDTPPLLTPEPALVGKAGNPQVSLEGELVAEVSVSDPVMQIKKTLTEALWDMLRRDNLKPVSSEHAEADEEEIAR